MTRLRLALPIAILVAACTGAPLATPSTEPATAAPTAASPATAAVTQVPATPGLPSFNPTEPLMLFGHLTGAGGGIFVMHADGSARTQLATDVLPGIHKRGRWSPDGQRVVFVDEANEGLYVAHLDGSPTERLPGCDHNGCDYPQWSPDGTKIAYSRVTGAPGIEGPASVGIEVLDLASGKATEAIRLSRPTLADVPSFSPDGNEIAFQVDEMDDQAFETGSGLAVVPVTGGNPRYIVEFPKYVSGPEWGWATNRIVFSVELTALQKDWPGGGTWDLWTVRPDGSHLTQITHLPEGGQLRGAHWSPDGKTITAYDVVAGQGVRIDPATGVITRFLTTGVETVPMFRPIKS